MPRPAIPSHCNLRKNYAAHYDTIQPLHTVHLAGLYLAAAQWSREYAMRTFGFASVPQTQGPTESCPIMHRHSNKVYETTITRSLGRSLPASYYAQIYGVELVETRTPLIRKLWSPPPAPAVMSRVSVTSNIQLYVAMRLRAERLKLRSGPAAAGEL
jgi:hypothetical protein